MKKIYLIFSSVVLVVILLNVIYYFDLKKQQIIFQKKYITEQGSACVSKLENTEMELENDFNAFMFSNDISALTNMDQKSNELTQKVEMLYSKYPNLISNISLFDQNKNVFSLYRDNKEVFIADRFTTHAQQSITDKEAVIFENNLYHFVFPIYKEKVLFGNLDVTLDQNKYFDNLFQGYLINNMLWQWVIDKSGKTIYSNETLKIELKEDTLEISNNIKKDLQGFVIHDVLINGEKQTVLSSYFPAKFLKSDLGIVFSFNLNDIFSNIRNKAIIIILCSIILIVIVFFLLRKALLAIDRQDKIHRKAEKDFVLIFDSIPIGVLILTQDKIIRHINRTASEMLYGREEKNIIGRNITDLILPKYFSDKNTVDSAFDTNHFYYFQKDGDEVVIYKREIPFELDSEHLIIDAFIDISPIEKARKLEAAANLAKSDFLAKMSHEIRTPLNGIVGMADALIQLKLTTEQRDFAEIIKKSSDLLLTIINDVLDYSKIEAGKMVLEEIPFKISDEITFARELFKPLAEEKKLKIITRIASNVPNNIIGDPFRLRQVISNLMSNAVKFTHEGEVSISVELLEEYSGNLTLQVNVEDTGIGIPKEKLDTIFSSYTQAEGSTTRKYGGSGLGTTISKQLVELMSGEIWVESPSTISTNSEFPGTKFSFTIEAYSNEKIQKNYDFNNIRNYEDIFSLVITDNSSDGETIYNYLLNFGTNYEIYTYHSETPELLVNKLLIEYQKFHMIFIKDSLDFDGFKIAKTLFEKGITYKHLFVMVSSNDNVGNFIKAKRLGIDYYLIKPYESSEVFDIIQDNFTTIKNDLKFIPKLNKMRKEISILVAEDNLINQKVAKTIFKNLGYEISIAQNGVEAVDMALEKDFDIIFMDMMMPEKDGVQATKDLRKKGYNKPIIAMTANATKEGKNKAISFGMDGYITKPSKMEAIKKILIKYFSETINEISS
jgi:PAS domain S-box-containing protein